MMDRLVAAQPLHSPCYLLMLLVIMGCATASRTHRDAEKLVAARQLTLRGLDAVEQNDWASAEDLFREAVSASPHDERAHLQYSKALWHRGERQEAAKHMAEAVRLSGDAPELLVELGHMQLAMGDLEAARESGMQAARADRQFAAAHTLVGDVLWRQQRLDQALESFHLSLSLEPRQPNVLLSVAAIYRTWDEPRRMLSTLQSLEADELSPHLAGYTYFLRGIAEHRLGRKADAVNHLAKASALIPTAEVYCELASAQQSSGDVAAAKISLQKALEADANHQPSKALLAQLNLLPEFAKQPVGGATARR